MATKNIGRDRDEHFDSLILLVPNLGMEGQPRPERKRPTFPKYLGTNFQVRVPHLVSQPVLLTAPCIQKVLR